MLKVNELYFTVQGEGPLAGTPMILVRLQGCTVGCPFCDTRETWKAEENRVADLTTARSHPAFWCEMTTKAIADEVERLAPCGTSWVMLTGGEPFEQDPSQLLHELRQRGFQVNIESSGTAFPSGYTSSLIGHLTVSPKIDMPGGAVLNPEAITRANSFKILVGKAGDVGKAVAALELILGFRVPKENVWSSLSGDLKNPWISR